MFVKSILADEIEKLPKAVFPGSIEVIDEKDALYREAIECLSSSDVIGFDTESRPTFSPNQPPYGISLLQLSSGERAFLFRLKHLGLTPDLCRILSDPLILKIGAAVADDIKGLQKHRNFTSGGFVDLQKIVWEWGIKDKSVKKMAAIIMGVKVSKTQQLSNWEAEVLSDSQKMYAATDSWICEMMYRKLLTSPKNPLSAEEMAPKPAPKAEEPSAIDSGTDLLGKILSGAVVKPLKPKKKKKKTDETWWKKKKAKTTKNVPDGNGSGADIPKKKKKHKHKKEASQGASSPKTAE